MSVMGFLGNLFGNEPATAPGWCEAGERHAYQAGDHAEGRSYFERALNLDPRSARAWTGLGSCRHGLGLFQEAIQAFDNAIAADPRWKGAHNNKADALNYLGCFAEGLGCANQALAIDDQYVPAWNNRGTSLDQLHRLDEAAAAYVKALRIDPLLRNAWYNRAIVEEKRGRFRSATDSLGRFMGIAWFRAMGFAEEVAAWYESLRAKAQEEGSPHRGPGGAAEWYRKGQESQAQKQDEEAIRCYDRVIELDPHFLGGWGNKANCLRRMGRTAESIEFFDRALDRDPRDPSVWFNQALALEELGRKEQALHSFICFLKVADAEEFGPASEVARERIQALGGQAPS